jgi:hypothetical protein
VLLQRQHTFYPTLITAVLAGSLPASRILSPYPAPPNPYRVRSTLTRGGYRVVHSDTVSSYCFFIYTYILIVSLYITIYDIYTY